VTRPRVVLLHGSVTNAALSWGGQAALADRFELVLPNRPGFPPNPPLERVDFDEDAVWLESVVRPGDHLVGHSYGGVVALIAAPRLPLASLTVIEPPAFGVARGDPAVERWLQVAASHVSPCALTSKPSSPMSVRDFRCPTRYRLIFSRARRRSTTSGGRTKP
jgi:pimeloyl-ACP methyl ester carboxylesterase